ncbi:hypothetical protein M8C21_013612 [Ambrosia artemisiifolia]|uniref:RING-type domain-containing protein n=1 Tax=Ambrosia artemisiifolia TaxID=4212 RepID=A0AAD5GDW7_AMBAR|nr:hypothetical protein M8C21_013612 [Ambrosia artemisiifolia]
MREHRRDRLQAIAQTITRVEWLAPGHCSRPPQNPRQLRHNCCSLCSSWLAHARLSVGLFRLMETSGVSNDHLDSDNHPINNNNNNSSNPSLPATRMSSSPRTTSSPPPFPVISSTGSASGTGMVSVNNNNNDSCDGDNNNNNSEISIRIMSGGDNEEERGESAAVEGGREGEVSGSGDASVGTGTGVNDNNSNVDSANQQRYDLQQLSRWIEQILPFSLLLLTVFVRQHLQGILVTVYIIAFMYKSNDILRKQTALKGERKLSVLVGYCIVFLLHVIGFYWWYQNNNLCNPLFMVPPKAIPPFWNAIFTIIVNDTMVRQAAMAFKLVLLMYYKNGRSHSFRRQGQMLTLVEYTLLLYRAFLPTPVWYRFFLNKEYGSLFSSLTTGLYLTLKLTSVVEKVGSFYAALKALSRKEVNYGSHATAEQVSEAGDLCAICQEKMQAPILLRCKHIFCEDCVSEWFERERTCPLCRALVRPADIRTFGDGSTSLFFQVF